jgi:long-chain acyl-CoA synthetase
VIDKDPVLEAIWERNYPGSMRRFIDIPNITLYALLKNSCQMYGERIFVSYLGRKFTYSEILTEVDRFASFLHEKGVKMGDSVAILLPNCPQFIIALFAIVKLGGTVAPMNILFTENEIRERSRETQSKIFIVMEDLIPRVMNIFSTELKHLIIVDKEAYKGGNVFSTVMKRMSNLVESRLTNVNIHYMSELKNEFVSVEEEKIDQSKAVGVISFTSGASSVPIGVLLTHTNLISNAYQIREWAQPIPKDSLSVVVGAPFHHVYGLVSGIISPILMGSRIIIIEDFSDTLEALSTISREGNVFFPAIPYMHREIFKAINQRQPSVSCVAAMVSGGSLSVENSGTEDSSKRSEYLEGYGMSEASSSISFMPVSYNVYKENSAGLPLPNTSVRIVDTKTGKSFVPIGEPGELIVKGPQIMLGYCQNPMATNKNIREGWLFTGDIASIDNDGFIFIHGKKHDVFTSNGFLVYPSEVEKVIMGNKNVEEVAVLGYKKEDIYYIKAFIVPKKGVKVTEAEILTLCNRSLADYKIPNSIEFVEFLPKNALGKIMKKPLMERVMAQ